MEQNKEIVRAAFEGPEEVVRHARAVVQPGLGRSLPGMPPLDADGHKQYSVVMNTAFPDLERTLEDLVAEGDRVVVRSSARGTHSGDFNGIPPTGNVASSSGITIFRIAGGQIVEEWSESDMLGLLQQVGAIPSPG